MHMLYDKSFGIPRIMRDVSYVFFFDFKNSEELFNRDKKQRFEDFAADPRNFAVRCCCWKPTVKNWASRPQWGGLPYEWYGMYG